MNQIEIFTNEAFGQVRAVQEGDKTLFCGSDIAKALGYSRPSDAVSTHCRYTAKYSVPHPQSRNKFIDMI